jgi:UDP-N-acetylglucosamine--N-acetylmuramyl-(pentapeptide) pyrophosphoryl-undecaprenol N-acetylglucosamine transferase
MTKKIVITGTHLTPAVELISQLREDSIKWEIVYIGRNFNSHENISPSIESLAIPKLGVKFFGFNSGKLDRRWLPNTLAGIPLTIKAFFNIFQILREVAPDITVSFGGYISVPVIISSYLQKVPSITHEQTPTLSLSTKINAKFSNKVALSFPQKITNDKYIFTGNLLRRQIFNTKSDFFEKQNIKLPIIYITGGNQGSNLINKITADIKLKLIKKFYIIHQTGNQSYLTSKNYLPINFIDDIGWVLNHANIVISRAGANTCQEIITLSKKSILIPMKVSQQNEQEKNSLLVKGKIPETIIIPESKLNSSVLLKAINELNKVATKNINQPTINYSLLKLIKTL